ncbi:hypothetical protein AWB79_02422 [Caballeronia hypogeia]|uniref:Lipoprotein n=1 Tax=Caballeronia hypogeia TaxID=1777140 RepID=A0A158AIH2_9BURK|nr:DUF3313 domain-containing protein [Caballeronia hypogeia]SAK57614.1 hypothetical protein AWB79_02422 [Caballeronia hypogeia]
MESNARTLIARRTTGLSVVCALVETSESRNSPLRSSLQQTQDPNGETFLRYVNPRLSPANYSAVMVEPISMYPTAEPGDQLSQATIDQIRSCGTTCLRQAIGSRVRVVEAPGARVVKLQVAVTGVANTAEGLKPNQVVPMAFVATMAVNSVAGAPQMAKLLVDALATDSRAHAYRRALAARRIEYAGDHV